MFIHLFVEGHLGRFNLLAVVNNTGGNMGVSYPFRSLLSALLSIHPEVELLDHMISFLRNHHNISSGCIIYISPPFHSCWTSGLLNVLAVMNNTQTVLVCLLVHLRPHFHWVYASNGNCWAVCMQMFTSNRECQSSTKFPFQVTLLPTLWQTRCPHSCQLGLSVVRTLAILMST